ncbi:MAG: hypothetical protein R3244_06965 [Thermoanaerobaculia bacterium]|nr:hypothetical protein [Thermoanaerobaculia bacterium]
MRRVAILALLVFVVFVASVADARPAKTEFVTGSGTMWAAFGLQTQFDIDVSQLDPDEPTGTFIAALFSFPSHFFLAFEATSFDALDVDRRTGRVTGTALVADERTGFEGEIEFTAIFEDLASLKGRNKEDDRLTLTLELPTGAETFAGTIPFGDVEVGTRKR